MDVLKRICNSNNIHLIYAMLWKPHLLPTVNNTVPGNNSTHGIKEIVTSPFKLIGLQWAHFP
jgi:hypothetical protein